MRQPPQSHQHKRTQRAEERLGGRRVSWNDRVLEPSKDRVETHSKQEATRRTALPDGSGHGELSSALSCELNLRSAVAADHAQELWQPRFFENVKINAWISSGKIRQ